MSLTASTVSRQLRRADFLPSHADRQYKHEGLFVRGSTPDRVSVHVDIDPPGKRQRLATDVREALLGLGYAVEGDPAADIVIFYVTEKG